MESRIFLALLKCKIERRFHKHRLTYSIKEDFDDNGGTKIGRIENWLVPI